MNYLECVNTMENLSKFGMNLGLDTIKDLLNRLDNPQKGLKYVHVAGTNGKGSVCAYLTKILTIAGYKVGTFNSPSVFEYNERFLINGKPIDNDKVEKYLNIVLDERNKMEKDGVKSLPTAYELETAAAFLLFKEEACDIVIMECGMGGRLDATNVIEFEDKLLSIITSISFDHTQYLGDTLAKIAAEKFAIVTKTLITYEQNPEVMDILSCAPKLILAKEAKMGIATLSGITFTYNRHFYRISMLGEHQIQNATLAIEAARKLKWLGYYNITTKVIQEALYKTTWPGRLDKKNVKGKIVILDGAHNPGGARTLYNAIKLHCPNTKISYVFGAFKDKDIDGILNAMNDSLKTMYIAKAPTERGLDVDSLKTICEKYCQNVITNASITEALNKAIADDSKIVVVFGSLSILREANDAIKAINE